VPNATCDGLSTSKHPNSNSITIISIWYDYDLPSISMLSSLVPDAADGTNIIFCSVKCGITYDAGMVPKINLHND